MSRPWLAVAVAALWGAAAPAQTFSGRYLHRMSEGEMILTLEQSGVRVSGLLALPIGLTMQLAGSVEGGLARGVLRSESREAKFEARLTGAQLLLKLAAPDSEPEEYTFLRQGQEAALARPSGPAKPGGMAGDPVLGFRFLPPAGWRAERVAVGFALVSDAQPGMALVLPHRVAKPEELRARVLEGMVEDEDTRMTVEGELEAPGPARVAANLAGKMDGQPARARVVGLLSPFGGGALIIASAPEAEYTAGHAGLADAIARSIEFFKPQAPRETPEWESRLRAKQLDSPEGRRIGLCSNGSFVETAGVRLTGKWAVVSQGGLPALELAWPGGREETFLLTTDGARVFLEGAEWKFSADTLCGR